MINPAKLRLFYIYFGHFIDHMLMLIFAKAAFNAGISFGIGKDMAYAEMIPYGIPSLIPVSYTHLTLPTNREV